MDFLIRFGGVHETFRLAEIQALAVLEGVRLDVVFHDTDSPFCVVNLDSPAAAAALIRRSVLTQSIHELWGQGATYHSLHGSVRSLSTPKWPSYAKASWKFNVDCYRGPGRTQEAKIAVIDSFSYLPLAGPIRLRDAETEFTVFEHWSPNAVPLGLTEPEKIYLGVRVKGASSSRDLVQHFDLKKRRYISTTSMDSELALVTANIALAGPGKLFYDPFAGTGSFPVAAAQWGALAWGSDIDGRALRGDEGGPRGKTLRGNFEQYGLLGRFGGCFTSDLTNAPIRKCPLSPADGNRSDRGRWLDGILCDPPYGVREGLRVLGVKDEEKKAYAVEIGKKIYKEPDFVPPKRPYSFLAMLDDILTFAAETLVDGGRLAFWMPTANDEALELAIPEHPCLEIVTVCVQAFGKWSRRLIAYRRMPDSQVDGEALREAMERRETSKAAWDEGTTVDELNPFRRGYFTKFKTDYVVASATRKEAAASAEVNEEKT